MSYVLHLQRGGGGDREDGGDSLTHTGRFNCIFITHLYLRFERTHSCKMKPNKLLWASDSKNA